MPIEPQNDLPQSFDHPPDRTHLRTEQRNPRSMSFHELDIAGCVKLMNDEDALIAAAVRTAHPVITDFITAVDQRFNRRNGRLIYLGAGTSGRLGVLDASEMPPTFQLPFGRIIGIIAGGDRALRFSSEGMEDDPDGAHPALEELGLTKNDCVLGIAAGGTTPYVLGGLKHAHEKVGALTGLLTCTPLPDDHLYIDHLLFIDTGPELVTGSTRLKAGTATKLVLNTISTTLMIQSSRVYENLMVDLRATNNKLCDRAARVITTVTDLSREEAFALLGRSDGSVKCSIVMQMCKVERLEAVAILEASGGDLAKVLESKNVPD